MARWKTQPFDRNLQKYYPHGSHKYGIETVQEGVQEYGRKKKNGNRLASLAEVRRLQHESVNRPKSRVVVVKEVVKVRQAEIVQQVVPLSQNVAEPNSPVNPFNPGPMKTRIVEKEVVRVTVKKVKLDKDVPQHRCCRMAWPKIAIR